MWAQSKFPGSHHTPGNLPFPKLIILLLVLVAGVFGSRTSSSLSLKAPLQALDKVPAPRTLASYTQILLKSSGKIVN